MKALGAAAAGLGGTAFNCLLFGAAAFALRGGFSGLPPGAPAALIAAFILLKALPVYAARAAVPGASARERLSLRDATFRAALRAFRKPSETADAGEATALITEGVESLELYRGLFFPQLVVGVLSPLIVCASVALFDPLSALILLAFAPLAPVMVNLLRLRFRDATERYYRETAVLLNRFREGLLGLATVKLFGRGAAYAAEIRAANEGHRAAAMGLLAVNQLLILFMDLSSSLGAVVAGALTAAWRFRSGAVDAAEALFIVLASVELTRPLQLMGAFFFAGAGGRNALRKAAAFAQAHPAPPAAARAAALPADAVLELESVSYAHERGGASCLREVTLRVPRGSLVGLRGASGSGKTTLRRILSGVAEPDSGRVRIGGRDFGGDGAGRRDLVAVADQHPYLFSGSLRENLLLAAPEATEEALRRALAEAGLAAFLDALPAGLDSPVGEEGRLLSGGQRARLALARALLRNAPFLILDEPSADLDGETERAVVRAAAAAAERGAGVLIISHREAPLAACGRVYALEGGSLS